MKTKYDVEQAYDGEEGILYAREGIFDLILLDIMMPLKNGYEVLSQLRKEKIQTPVLILTAKDGLQDKILGFRAGADDYLVKPFEREELLLRIEAILRRSNGIDRENLIQYKGLHLNLGTREATIDGKKLNIQGKQFDMLEYLITCNNTIITKEQIFDKIWGFNSDTTTNVVEVYASGLRKALKQYGYDKYLKTIRSIRIYLERIGRKASMILNEEKIIRKQLLKNMVYNFLIFTIIFTIFGLIIFQTVKSSIYESSTRELNIAQERFGNTIRGDRPITKAKENIRQQEAKEPIQVNPRVLYILRDEEGTILNADALGRIYEEYQENIGFDANNLDQIYEIQLNHQYTYRAMNKQVKIGEETNYVQLLINVDAEKAIMNNYGKILLIGISITVLLSLIASYMISKKSLKPIITSWKKQTEFVQNASHELRTPLTIIQTKQELLLQEPESKIIDKSEDIMLSLNEAKRLSKMTKDLMLLARADSDHIQLEKEPIQLDQLIQEVTMPYIDFAKVEEKQIQLELQPEQTVLVDKNKMHQLFVILLDNAIKYTRPKDTITIHTYEKDSKCIIEIKDTGIGISEEGLKHVFERFYREDKARSRKTGGTGLGLSIAEYMVNLHKGSIKITHNEPNGTIVTIKIPKN